MGGFIYIYRRYTGPDGEEMVSRSEVQLIPIIYDDDKDENKADDTNDEHEVDDNQNYAEICSKLHANKKKDIKKIFGYENKHKSEFEEVLHIKCLFILDNGLPKTDSNAKKALMLLLADRHFLFGDRDCVYRSRYANREVLKLKKQAARELKQSENNNGDNLAWNNIIDSALTEFYKKNADGCKYDALYDIELARKIMMAVIQNAKSKKLGLPEWIYSNEHHASVSLRKKQIEKIKTGNYLSPEMPDVESCRKDFEKLVPECCAYPAFTIEFCTIIIRCLVHCAALTYQINTPTAEQRGYFDSSRILKYYPIFQRREQIIRKLEDEFRTATNHWKRLKSVNIGLIGSQTCVSKQDGQRELIECYCSENEIFLNERTIRKIQWILTPNRKPLTDKSSDSLNALLILSCLFPSDNQQAKSLDNIKIVPDFIKRSSRAMQRMKHLKALDAIFNILELPEDLRVISWDEYLLRNGKGIESKDELSFWREKLGNDYMRLPIIGFQLCALDFCGNCISDSLGTNHMSYKDYEEFCKSNPSCLHRLAKSIVDIAKSRKDVEQILKDYCRLWKTSKGQRPDYLELVGQLHGLIKDKLSDVLPGIESLKELFVEHILEKAIRMIYEDKAKCKLLSWYDKTYGCSLHKFIEF